VALEQFPQLLLWRARGGAHQSVERLEDEDQESSLSAPVPTFAKAAKVGHPPYSKREGAMLRGLLFTTLLAFASWWLFAKWPISALPHNQHFTLVKLSPESFQTVYPLILGGVLLIVFVAFARNGWGFRWNRAVFGRIGLAVFAVYLLICATAHWMALKQIEHFATERRIVALARAVARSDAFSFVGPIRWNGAVLTDKGVYDGEITPLPNLARFPTFGTSFRKHSFL